VARITGYTSSISKMGGISDRLHMFALMQETEYLHCVLLFISSSFCTVL